MKNLLGCKLEFNNHSIRLAGSFKDPWYCYEDVARSLGSPEEAIRNHFKGSDERSLRNIIDYEQFNRVREEDLDSIYVNMDGVYSLALNSDPEIGDAFVEWNRTIVLPLIAKLEHSYLQTLIHRLLVENKDMRSECNKLQHENRELRWINTYTVLYFKDADLSQLRDIANAAQSENDDLQDMKKHLQTTNKDLQSKALKRMESVSSQVNGDAAI